MARRLFLTALLESRPEWTFRADKWQRQRDGLNLNRGQHALIDRSAKRSAEEVAADELAVTVRGMREMINDPVYELVPKHQRLDQARVSFGYHFAKSSCSKAFPPGPTGPHPC